jgi:dinuclear metal center YbgI/SA1388 family protein
MAEADRVQDWVALVDAYYPEADAAGWDNTGLQVGDPAAAVSSVLVCLDVVDATLDEAAEVGADLVLAHHPLMFRPLQRLTPETAAGRLALRAATEGRGVLAAHTNLDVAAEGTTEPITSLLGLTDIRPLAPQRDEAAEKVKLVTFVPAEATGAVLEAFSAAGAGVIGDYDYCAFRVGGTGSFRPSAAANPHLGARREVNEVAEQRVEVELPHGRLTAAVDALLAAHPYEEVPYDVYPVLDQAGQTHKGLGRVGELAQPQPLRDIADQLAIGLPAPFLRVAGSLEAPVRTVAACGGAGDGLIEAARRAGADLYVTSDLRHHPTLDASTVGLATIDAGHYATEAAALPALRELLAQAAAARGLTARLLASAARTEPWVPYTPPTG